MSESELSRWLRSERRARRWDVPTMARALARAAGDERHTLPGLESLRASVRRWERGDGGVSERYRMLYCTAFGIGLDEFPFPRPGAAAAQAAGPGYGPGLIAALRDICELLCEDAKLATTRADQANAPVRAALYRGQALAYTAAAEHVSAALSRAQEEPAP